MKATANISDTTLKVKFSDVTFLKGDPGESAYEIALKNGFEGTEEEWLRSLKGEKGDKGEQGEQGDKGEPGEVTLEYANNTFSNALKGSTSDTFISLDDVSPIPHIVKCKLEGENIEDTTVKVCGANLFNAYDLSYTSQGDRCKAETIGAGAIRVLVNKPSDYMNANVFVIKTASLEVGKLLYATANIAKGDEGNTAGLALYAYNTTTKKGITIFSHRDESNTGKARCVVKLTDAHINNYDEIRILFYYNASSVTGWQVGDYVDFSNIMVTYSTEQDYKPYQGTEYTPDASGNVDIASISPDMNIYSDTDGVMINADYNRDINKAFAELQQAILSLGGNV